MEPNHRSSKENRHLQLKMHELIQCSDTNFVTTQTQGYMAGTKGMGRLKVTNSQSKPHNLNNIKRFSINITFNNANAFNNKSHLWFYILINPKSNSNHAFNTNHNHKLLNYIKHMENIFIQTILLRCLKIMQYHISLHSIAGEEWDRRNIGEVTFNSRDPGKNSWGESDLTE